MSRASSRVNLHSIVYLHVKEIFARSRCHICSLSDSNWIRTHNHLVCKRTLNHLAKLAIIMSCTSFKVNLHSIVCLNVKEVLTRSRCHIWSLGDSNWIRTHNQLVRKRILNHLAKLASLAKWLTVRLRTKRLSVQIQLLSP